jgi:predicted MFS family arabinose efflux permease
VWSQAGVIERSSSTVTAALLTRPFVLGFAAHFLHALSFSLFLHLPGFVRGLGGDELDVGLIAGITALTAILVRPLIGGSIDRARRGTILVGGAAHVAICAMYLTVDALGPWLYIVRAVHGACEAALFAALFTYAADVVPPARRIEGIALFGVSGMLPMSLSGLLGDAILARADYPTLFVVAVGFVSGGFLLSLPLRDPSRERSEPSRGFFTAIREPSLLPIWVVGLCFSTAIVAYFTFMKTFVLETGVSGVGLFFSIYSISAIAVRIGLGALPDRFGAKRVLFPALATLALGFGLLATTTEIGVAIAGVLCGLGHGFTFPILLGLVVSRARPSERGAALALYTALFDAGTLVGGPLLGFVIHHHGYPAMFGCAGALVVIGTLAFWLGDRA